MELLVVISITSIVMLVFLGVVSNYFVLISRNNQLSEMTVTSQNLLRATVENIRFGDGVRQTNTLTDPNAPSGGWNTSNTLFVIVIAVPALDSAGEYIIDPDTGSPYMNELVYYKDGSTLMQRKLANSAAVGNVMLTSCPANLQTSSCPADIHLADYVDSMIFTLYDQDGVVTASPVDARSIKIDLNMQRGTSASQALKQSTNIRVTLRNRF